MNITSNFHRVQKVVPEPIQQRYLDDGKIYYTRKLCIWIGDDDVNHVLFADTLAALELPGEAEERQIKGLKAAISETQTLLPYADHGAYSQDLARISEMKGEVTQLEVQRSSRLA